VVGILSDPDHDRPARIGQAARARILGAHTADCRAAELENYLAEAMRRERGAATRERESLAV
jgi:hypothetical protein